MYAVIRLDPLEVAAEYPHIPGRLVWPSRDETHGVVVGDTNHGYIFVNKTKVEEPPTSFHYPSGAERFYKNNTLKEVVLYSEPDITHVRELAKSRITAWKETQQNSGFEHAGMHYQSDSKSRKAIHDAAFMALASLSEGESYDVKWSTTNNSQVLMKARDVVQFGKTAASSFQNWHEKANELKAEIDTKTNAADIQAVLDTVRA